ncbi:MAG: hypothetical protein K6B13_03835, partial [Prevotella sp.]|nr:hypothetical protein [Prevotella sp.]
APKETDSAGQQPDRIRFFLSEHEIDIEGTLAWMIHVFSSSHRMDGIIAWFKGKAGEKCTKALYRFFLKPLWSINSHSKRRNHVLFHPRSPQFFFTFRIFRPKASDEESEAFGQRVRSLRTECPKPSDFFEAARQRCEKLAPLPMRTETD